MAQRHKRVVVNASVVGLIFIFKGKLFVIYKYFHFFALVTMQRTALISATQHEMSRKYDGMGNGV